MTKREGWTFDRKLSVGLFLFIITQTLSIVRWVAQLDSRVNDESNNKLLEQRIEFNTKGLEKVEKRVDEKFDKIEDKLDKLLYK